MSTYKFPNFDTEFIDPTITMNGDAGTRINNNVPEDVAYCDLLIETPNTKKSAFRLEGSPKPVDWTVQELSIWVAANLVKYEVK
jgi:hypothetical protein